MDDFRPGTERTTEDIRRIIQTSGETTAALARRFHINPKTVTKWRRRNTVTRFRGGPRRSNVLTLDEEQLIVNLRWFNLLPLDDLLFVLQDSMPHLTRSSLHRCLQRHGVSHLPALPLDPVAAARVGQFFINTINIQTADGMLNTWGAVDLKSRFSYGELHPIVTPELSAEALGSMCAAIPYAVRKVLTPRAGAFCHMEPDRTGPHPFQEACRRLGIAHEFVPEGFPWTRDQLAKLNNDVASANKAGKFMRTAAEVRAHMRDFVIQRNFVSRLKTLGGLTPFQYAARAEQIDWRRYLETCPFNIVASRPIPLP